MRVCDVYIEETFLQNQTLTYLCQDFDVAFGNRVWVNVRGRRMMAFVKSVYEASLDAFEFELQPILSVVDDTAIINQELFEIAEFMSYQTVTPLIRCLQTVLPNKLRPQTNATKPKMTRGIQYIGGADEDTLTKKQREF
ncbi:MAG TPA: primosomal protein N', partial [Erysipelothrix sp.]|nr:primosomal protein N' [Erysipelothrix sp.]